MKSLLQDKDIEMYSTHNKQKFVVVKRFIRILKNKISKYMTSVSKNLYINKLDDIVNKYNSTYCSAIKINLFMLSLAYILTLQLKLIIKTLNLRFVTMLLVILMVKKLLERFTKKNCKWQVKQTLEFKK